jgi:hypothetical protein
MAFSRLKIKQIQSVSQIFGKVVKSDGSGNTIWSDLIERGTTFPSNPQGGDVFYKTDREAIYHYDDSRSKWLTIKTLLYSCGRSNIQKNVSAYLEVGDAIQSSTNGFIMTHDGTILSATADNANIMVTSRDIEIRVNNSTTNRVLLTIPAASKSITTITANQDFSAGDVIQE